MGFGEKFEPTNYNSSVPEGDYEVTLGMPQDVSRNGWDMRDIPISIKGHAGAQPKVWTWFDCPTGDVEKIAKWNSQRTRDCDAFGVSRGDFRPESWFGKIGTVHIGKDNAGYMKVLWSVADPTVPKKTPFRDSEPPIDGYEKQADEPTDDIPF